MENEVKNKASKEPVKLKLVHPVKHGEEEIKEITLRRPLAGDIYDFPGEPTMGDLLNLASKLGNQPPSVIKKLEMEDTFPLLEIVGNFMGTGRKAGPT